MPMDINKIKKLLKSYGLKLTLCRYKLFEILSSADRALTYGEFLKLTGNSIDRVSLYRTLKSFEDLGIIHRVLGADGTSNYALSYSENAALEIEKPNAQHLHFSCIICHGVFCLDTELVPAVSLPDAYEVHSLNMTVTGVCRSCNNK
jgi:Fur family ferric uptake transcriptional regulator